MPIKLPSDLAVLASPVNTDILIAQRLPEQAAKQLTIADILALVSTPPIAPGSITTAMLAIRACTNIAASGVTNISLGSVYSTILDVNLTIEEANSYVIVVGVFSGYGQRAAGQSGDYGAEFQLSKAYGAVITAGFAGFASGGYTGASVSIGTTSTLVGLYLTGSSTGLTTFRLSAKYVSGSASGVCAAANMYAFEMKR